MIDDCSIIHYKKRSGLSSVMYRHPSLIMCDVLCCVGEGSSSQYRLFAPKCICIITHWPFYRGLRTFLQQVSAHS
jgi:hypothetical protein